MKQPVRGLCVFSLLVCFVGSCLTGYSKKSDRNEKTIELTYSIFFPSTHI